MTADPTVICLFYNKNKRMRRVRSVFLVVTEPDVIHFHNIKS